MRERLLERRLFLRTTGAASAGLLVPAVMDAQQRPRPAAPAGHTEPADEDVAPPEDLMREHGVLNRVLLIYEEAIRRIDTQQEMPSEALHGSADIIRTFIEGYHEKLEEDYLFPRFEKAGKLVELTKVLRSQHEAGRRVTTKVLQLATAQGLKNQSSSTTLKDTLHQFIRMYRPHEAREDTVLFPALRQVVSKHEFDALGEDFEKKEHELFGEDGFEKMVERVATIERSLGIYELTMFTPRS